VNFQPLCPFGYRTACLYLPAACLLQSWWFSWWFLPWICLAPVGSGLLYAYSVVVTFTCGCSARAPTVTRVCAMNIAKPPWSTEIDKSSETDVGENIHAPANAAFQVGNSDDGMSANDLGALLRRVSERSIREIEGLIDELEKLRKKLQTDGDRIQRDITAYAELSERVIFTRYPSISAKRLWLPLRMQSTRRGEAYVNPCNWRRWLYRQSYGS
jgi:hypothetical protein